MTFLEVLEQRELLVSDGAWGTQLSAAGLDQDRVPEIANAEQPDLVERVAAAYVDAGSDIILTNTFGGTSLKLAKGGVTERAAELNRLGAHISRKAADEGVLVFGSVGPTGEFMEPLGLITEQQMVEAYGMQAVALAEGGVDGIVLETFTDLGEAKAALKGIKAETSLPVIASFTFDKGPAGYATMMGVKPKQAAQEMAAAGADSVGSNCGNGIENMVEVAGMLKDASDLPLWIKPNAGMPQLRDGKTVFLETPGQMAGQVPALIQAGTRIIGGCCGTTPEHIRAIRAAVDAHRGESQIRR